ncbi:MAG: hypothetical protein ACOCRK_10860 [bacterium]
MKLTNPLKVVRFKDNYDGRDWALAFSCGYDSEDGFNYVVTTNQVRSSELNDITVKDQAKLFATSYIMKNFIKDIFNELTLNNKIRAKKILDLIKGDDLIDTGKGVKRVNYISLFERDD